MDPRKMLWTLKGKAARVPGAYKAYQFATKKVGDGRVYTVPFGPLRGMKWRRDNRLPYWYHLGLWEPAVSNGITEHLRPGDVFWDVGANAGYHALHAARVVGSRGRVIAFEPDPVVLETLEDQLALNAIANCTIERAAISDHVGTATLMCHSNNLVNSLSDFRDDGVPVDVPTTTLDILLDKYPRPHVVKMDIEGAEVLALKAAERLLEGPDAPRLLLSTHGPEASAFCEGVLRRHGYQWTVDPGFEQMFVAFK